MGAGGDVADDGDADEDEREERQEGLEGEGGGELVAAEFAVAVLDGEDRLQPREAITQPVDESLLLLGPMQGQRLRTVPVGVLLAVDQGVDGGGGQHDRRSQRHEDLFQPAPPFAVLALALLAGHRPPPWSLPRIPSRTEAHVSAGRTGGGGPLYRSAPGRRRTRSDRLSGGGRSRRPRAHHRARGRGPGPGRGRGL